MTQIGGGKGLRTVAAGALLLGLIACASGARGEGDGKTFMNPIAGGADPWVIRHEGAYYWCQSENDRGVAVYRSDRLTELGEKFLVWQAPESGPYAKQVWAPELHRLDGRWYVYVAASDGENHNHRTIVLESEGDDPTAPFHLKSELYTGDSVETGEQNRWAIDTTVLEHRGQRYFLWSGWEDTRDEQFLYIARMANPWTTASNRVRICDNDDYLWERVDEDASQRGLHEAPQVLKSQGRVFVVYSCSGSWQPTYKLGMLELSADGDPMDPASWVKEPRPVFASTEETYGVGHPSFTTSPDGSQPWMAFHAKLDREPGWRRALFIQPYRYDAMGKPLFGRPVAAGQRLPLPAGQQPKGAEDEAATHRQISGVYPHLTTYGDYSSPDGAFTSRGRNECGIGAVVPWAGRLWMINYAPHEPHGSEHKLYSIDSELNLTIHPESVGGTPAARMIHRESNQLLIGPYLIDAEGQVRVIPPSRMPGRLTAIARHLSDPQNWVYYYDMEGMLYEANVHTLEVRKRFDKPVPGWHGKGAYTAQGRLVVANNGEAPAGGHSYESLQVEDLPRSPENAGVLAEWDGQRWSIVERRQFTDVTGPGGIEGNETAEAPLWAIGWDRRSLRLKLLDGGRWSTYLLPKAQHCNDPRHGWYTEWPRIRSIGPERALMDMHGMFFDFPPTFSAANTAGIRPLASHLRYIPDFCSWNGRLVLATDETSIQGNPLAGQPQSNLWFGHVRELEQWGPESGWGGPWVGDAVRAGQPSDPFLVAGFDHRTLHLAVGAGITDASSGVRRTSDQFSFDSLPDALRNLPCVTIDRGDWHQSAPGYRFQIDREAIVYLAVDRRGQPELGESWQPTEMTLSWGGGRYGDVVFAKRFPAGIVAIPANTLEHTPGSFGMPHAAFIAPATPEGELPRIVLSEAAERQGGEVSLPAPAAQRVEAARESDAAAPVRFTIEADANGNGSWRSVATVSVPEGGYVAHSLPRALTAEWLRLRTDRDCTATAYFHLTDDDHPPLQADRRFAGLAAADADGPAYNALLFAARRNRNLRVLEETASDGAVTAWELTKGGFEFRPAEEDPSLRERLRIEPEYTVDEASVILHTEAGRLRLPKGSEALERLWKQNPWRAVREVESERHLANVLGTFYEVPLVRNGQPPEFRKMRPVSSHNLQIHDFCSWNGLLVLSGVHSGAPEDGHVVRSTDGRRALWLGGIDDLWRLGKPVGRGGPWKQTAVDAGEPSDAYLMTGFDRKTLTLETSVDATIRIEVDFDHQTGWHALEQLRVRGGEPLEFEFPDGFSAHWVRFIADRPCTATAWLEYR